MGYSCSRPAKETNRSQPRRNTTYTFKTGRSTHAKAPQHHGSSPSPHDNGSQLDTQRRRREFNPSFHNDLQQSPEATIAPVRKSLRSHDDDDATSSGSSTKVLPTEENHINNDATASLKRLESEAAQPPATASTHRARSQDSEPVINQGNFDDDPIHDNGAELIDSSSANSMNRPMFMNGTNTRFTGHVASFRRTSCSPQSSNTSISEDSTPLVSPFPRPANVLTPRRRCVTFVSSAGNGNDSIDD